MVDAILCQTCGEGQPVHKSVNVDGRLLIGKHRCKRYLKAEYWHSGNRLAVELSEYPGQSGRQHLVRLLGGTASDDWQPPNGDRGWIAYWVYYDR